MHSGRIRTARLLTVSGREVCLLRGNLPIIWRFCFLRGDPPVNRQTRVKTSPTSTSFAGGKDADLPVILNDEISGNSNVDKAHNSGACT